MAISLYPVNSRKFGTGTSWIVDELRRFFGVTHFHRRSIPHIAYTQIPLNAYLKNEREKDKRPKKSFWRLARLFWNVSLILPLWRAQLLEKRFINARRRLILTPARLLSNSSIAFRSPSRFSLGNFYVGRPSTSRWPRVNGDLFGDWTFQLLSTW